MYHYSAQAVQPMDKRIHFALVCGAKSCPPIRVYTPEELDEGLDRELDLGTMRAAPIKAITQKHGS